MHGEQEPTGTELPRRRPWTRSDMIVAMWRTDEERWRAVEARAVAADRRFYYGVKTTGVFCRPTCRSRRPRRANVEFFDTVAAALRAGYRACRRCRPSAAPEASVVTEACRRLAADEAATTADIAAAIGLSPSYFQRLFKQQLGVTPGQYRRRVRAGRGREALGKSGSVTEAVYEAGYGASSRFYDDVGKELGMAPSAARAGAPGEVIRYSVATCSLGRLLVAWTERGVCEVAFGESAQPLIRKLHERFHRARVEQGRDCAWVSAVVRAVEMEERMEVPLDIRGTAFQERVWRVLRAIPPGETRTYAAVAAALGQPAAVRAVGRACSANRLAFLVPCHRVVGRGGELTGYRWGAERKRALLTREAKRAEKRSLK